MNAIAKEALRNCHGDKRDAIDALCDGVYLHNAGYTDSDQNEIGCAVAELKKNI
jgi:hypothetical protein